MGRSKAKGITVRCNWCGKDRLVLPCHYKQRKSKVFYCSVSHQLQYRNKYNNPSKREDVKKKIGASSKKRGAIYAALNSENYKNRKFVRRGKKNHGWKEKVTYGALHSWLKRTYGKADCCESKKCTGKSKYFEWALIKGRKYEKKRKNFKKLCKSCHHIYDGIINNIVNNI